jgi:hypothetical protein
LAIYTCNLSNVGLLNVIFGSGFAALRYFHFLPKAAQETI